MMRRLRFRENTIPTADPLHQEEFTEGSSREYEPPFIRELGRVVDITRGPFPSWVDAAAATAATISVASYVQGVAVELGKRTVETAPKAFKGISARLKFQGRGAKALVESGEIYIEVNSSVTTVILTKELSDDARLMLLDLDLSSKEFQGKAIRWDDTAEAWLPYGLEAHPRKRKRALPW